MKITPIAFTMIPHIEGDSDTDIIEALGLPPVGDENDMIRLIEYAGRNCYQSFHRPNPQTANPEDYVRFNIIAKEHFSVLEHASVTFDVQGVSRNMLLELERHRHISFSVKSQRFVKETVEIVTPPALAAYPSEEVAEKWAVAMKAVQEAYEAAFEHLSAKGLDKKPAREAARAILPGGQATQLVVTGNLRAWRDIMWKRWDMNADAEIREFAGVLLDWLSALAGPVFEDFPTDPLNYEEE